MIIGVILCSALIGAFTAIIRTIRPILSSGWVQAVRFQLECVFGPFGRWIPYMITAFPMLVILAMASRSNHAVITMEILFLFSLILLVLYQRIKQTGVSPLNA